MEIISQKHTACRVCGHGELKPYLDLGLIPLANNLFETQEEAINAPRLPLVVAWCDNCGLSQLTEVVSGRQLFRNYTYRSSVNQGYIEHCKKMALELKDKYGLNEETRHLDIAGNDGTLLYEFRKILNHHVTNIDPAKNLCDISRKKRIPSICAFWGLRVASYFEDTCDLITATNVFAHLDNVTEFLEACKIALKPDGVLVIENPYWMETMEGNQFDQVYFEHMTYWSIRPMMDLCEKVNLHLVNLSYQDIHGGTMRYEIRKQKGDKEITEDYEVNFWNELSDYQTWAANIYQLKDQISQNLTAIAKDKKVCAFAASAKGNTLLNFCGIGTDLIEFICDETPEKIGKYSPGTGIPIIGLESIINFQPDYVLILSWNFKEEIIAKLRPLIPNAKYIIPIPNWEVIN
jgi:SAM-dependent methyltransferase